MAEELQDVAHVWGRQFAAMGLFSTSKLKSTRGKLRATIFRERVRRVTAPEEEDDGMVDDGEGEEEVEEEEVAEEEWRSDYGEGSSDNESV